MLPHTFGHKRLRRHPSRATMGGVCWPSGRCDSGRPTPRRWRGLLGRSRNCTDHVPLSGITEESMSQPSNNAGPLVAMVALNTPLLPPPQALLASLRAVPGIAVDLTSFRAKDNVFVFGLGNDKATIALLPAPIPWPELEGPCAAAWWWPGATAAMRGHSAHVLVALMGDTGNPIQRHITLTHLVAAVASHTDAAGIYWAADASSTTRRRSASRPRISHRMSYRYRFGSISASSRTMIDPTGCLRRE